jgi:hypothetical protein
MSDKVRTQIEIPRDVFELLKQRGAAHGITPDQEIVQVLTAYLKEEVPPVLQADDPLLCVTPTANAGLGDLSTHHDRYLYRKDWQEPEQGEVPG